MFLKKFSDVIDKFKMSTACRGFSGTITRPSSRSQRPPTPKTLSLQLPTIRKGLINYGTNNESNIIPNNISKILNPQIQTKKIIAKSPSLNHIHLHQEFINLKRSLARSTIKRKDDKSSLKSSREIGYKYFSYEPLYTCKKMYRNPTNKAHVISSPIKNNYRWKNIYNKTILKKRITLSSKNFSKVIKGMGMEMKWPALYRYKGTLHKKQMFKTAKIPPQDVHPTNKKLFTETTQLTAPNVLNMNSNKFHIEKISKTIEENVLQRVIPSNINRGKPNNNTSRYILKNSEKNKKLWSPLYSYKGNNLENQKKDTNNVSTDAETNISTTFKQLDQVNNEPLYTYKGTNLEKQDKDVHNHSTDLKTNTSTVFKQIDRLNNEMAVNGKTEETPINPVYKTCPIENSVSMTQTSNTTLPKNYPQLINEITEKGEISTTEVKPNFPYVKNKLSTAKEEANKQIKNTSHLPNKCPSENTVIKENKNILQNNSPTNAPGKLIKNVFTSSVINSNSKESNSIANISINKYLRTNENPDTIIQPKRRIFTSATELTVRIPLFQNKQILSAIKYNYDSKMKYSTLPSRDTKHICKPQKRNGVARKAINYLSETMKSMGQTALFQNSILQKIIKPSEYYMPEASTVANRFKKWPMYYSSSICQADQINSKLNVSKENDKANLNSERSLNNLKVDDSGKAICENDHNDVETENSLTKTPLNNFNYKLKNKLQLADVKLCQCEKILSQRANKIIPTIRSEKETERPSRYKKEELNRIYSPKISNYDPIYSCKYKTNLETLNTRYLQTQSKKRNKLPKSQGSDCTLCTLKNSESFLKFTFVPKSRVNFFNKVNMKTIPDKAGNDFPIISPHSQVRNFIGNGVHVDIEGNKESLLLQTIKLFNNCINLNGANKYNYSINNFPPECESNQPYNKPVSNNHSSFYKLSDNFTFLDTSKPVNNFSYSNQNPDKIHGAKNQLLFESNFKTISPLTLVNIDTKAIHKDEFSKDINESYAESDNNISDYEVDLSSQQRLSPQQLASSNVISFSDQILRNKNKYFEKYHQTSVSVGSEGYHKTRVFNFTPKSINHLTREDDKVESEQNEKLNEIQRFEPVLKLDQNQGNKLYDQIRGQKTKLTDQWENADKDRAFVMTGMNPKIFQKWNNKNYVKKFSLEKLKMSIADVGFSPNVKIVSNSETKIKIKKRIVRSKHIKYRNYECVKKNPFIQYKIKTDDQENFNLRKKEKPPEVGAISEKLDSTQDIYSKICCEKEEQKPEKLDKFFNCPKNNAANKYEVMKTHPKQGLGVLTEALTREIQNQCASKDDLKNYSASQKPVKKLQVFVDQIESKVRKNDQSNIRTNQKLTKSARALSIKESELNLPGQRIPEVKTKTVNRNNVTEHQQNKAVTTNSEHFIILGKSGDNNPFTKLLSKADLKDDYPNSEISKNINFHRVNFIGSNNACHLNKPFKKLAVSKSVHKIPSDLKAKNDVVTTQNNHDDFALKHKHKVKQKKRYCPLAPSIEWQASNKTKVSLHFDRNKIHPALAISLAKSDDNLTPCNVNSPSNNGNIMQQLDCNQILFQLKDEHHKNKYDTVTKCESVTRQCSDISLKSSAARSEMDEVSKDKLTSNANNTLYPQAIDFIHEDSPSLRPSLTAIKGFNSSQTWISLTGPSNSKIKLPKLVLNCERSWYTENITFRNRIQFVALFPKNSAS